MFFYQDCAQIIIVLSSEITNDVYKVMILFLHFLVVATTLLSLPCPYENLHDFKDLVQSPHELVNKMSVMYLKKPMVFLILLIGPMAMIKT